jgi:hypothetical protein
MAGPLLEFAVSMQARTMFQTLKVEHGLTDDQIASVLIDWFAQLPFEKQQALLVDGDAAVNKASLISVCRMLDFSA